MEAIVLARKDFREFDQVISFYTKESGKVELLARGVKKIISKNSAHLEPFSYVQIEVAKGKEISHLTKVIPINFFAKIRQKLDKSLAAGFLASFINKITEVGETDKRLFELYLSWLAFLEKNDNFNFVLFDAFVVKLFSLLGFYPILDKCVVCEREYKELAKENILNGKNLAFYFAGGGIICPACHEKKEFVGEQIVNCGLKEINNMQVLLKNDWRVINEFNMEKIEKSKLHKLIYEFVLFHSERKIEDWGLLFNLKTAG